MALLFNIGTPIVRALSYCVVCCGTLLIEIGTLLIEIGTLLIDILCCATFLCSVVILASYGVRASTFYDFVDMVYLHFKFFNLVGAGLIGMIFILRFKLRRVRTRRNAQGKGRDVSRPSLAQMDSRNVQVKRQDEERASATQTPLLWQDEERASAPQVPLPGQDEERASPPLPWQDEERASAPQTPLPGQDEERTSAPQMPLPGQDEERASAPQVPLLWQDEERASAPLPWQDEERASGPQTPLLWEDEERANAPQTPLLWQDEERASAPQTMPLPWQDEERASDLQTPPQPQVLRPEVPPPPGPQVSPATQNQSSLLPNWMPPPSVLQSLLLPSPPPPPIIRSQPADGNFPTLPPLPTSPWELPSYYAPRDLSPKGKERERCGSSSSATKTKSVDGLGSSRSRKCGRKRGRCTSQGSSAAKAGVTTEGSRNRRKGRKYDVKGPRRTGQQWGTQGEQGNFQRSGESSTFPTFERWLEEREWGDGISKHAESMDRMERLLEEMEREDDRLRGHAESTDVYGTRHETQPRKDRVKKTEDKQYEDDLLLCVVCMDEPRKMLIRPCNHFCVCQTCANQLLKCPICKMYIFRSEVIFNV